MWAVPIRRTAVSAHLKGDSATSKLSEHLSVVPVEMEATFMWVFSSSRSSEGECGYILTITLTSSAAHSENCRIHCMVVGRLHADFHSANEIPSGSSQHPADAKKISTYFKLLPLDGELAIFKRWVVASRQPRFQCSRKGPRANNCIVAQKGMSFEVRASDRIYKRGDKQYNVIKTENLYFFL